MNHLANETSPYLQQHKHNPVDWYPWGEAAFEKAKREDKPILVSIGYSTCHWCHVMERESFENEDIAAVMNAYFVNIKVDREERPDVDAVYMEAVQIMTGAGGWPLNCFLLPDGRPFYGGTYFPPSSAYGRPSWGQVLQNLSKAFRNRRNEVEEQAAKLTRFVEAADNKILGEFEDRLAEGGKPLFDKSLLENIFYGIRERFDRVEGGIGSAPKFPSTMSLKFCLDYHYFTGNREALEQVELSLDRMAQGGIYDQIGGGFARYATDRAWLIPHFEKMLYDNALLVGLLTDAYKWTKKALYRETIVETLAFVEREMLDVSGGFYAAQDADSEGVEGKFYVWKKGEIEEILGEDAAVFCAFYGVSDEGNWEEVNILWRERTFEEFAAAQKLDLETFKLKMKIGRERLFAERQKRIKPSLDDKILLSWNALMTTAFATAYTAWGEARYLELAEGNLAFIFEHLEGEDYLFHTFKDGKRQYAAFLDDYALLIEALLQVFEVTQKTDYLEKASRWTAYVLEHFSDAETGLFFFTSALHSDLIVRKKDLYDSAMPSGNSTMVHNLLKISVLMDNKAYHERAVLMLKRALPSIEKYPTSFSKWASALQQFAYPMRELAIVGKEAAAFRAEVQGQLLPNLVVMTDEAGGGRYPLLEGRTAANDTLLYVCENYACQLPVRTVAAVLENLK